MDNEEESIDGIFNHLMLWFERPTNVFIRVEFESEQSKKIIINRISGALAEKNIPFSNKQLPRDLSPSSLTRGLINDLKEFKDGVVSISGFEIALGSGVDLEDRLQSFNYYREELANNNIRQIWWMTGDFLKRFIRAVPDLDSWFVGRLKCSENLPVIQSESCLGLPSETPQVDLSGLQQSADLRRKAAETVNNLLTEFDRDIAKGKSYQELDNLKNQITAGLYLAGYDNETQTTIRRNLDLKLFRYTHKEKKDFFISYNNADCQMAEWIAWVLEDAGYSTILQAWDFRAGSNFVVEMQKASIGCERTLAVLSNKYVNALFTQPEWAAAFSKDPTGIDRKLIPVRVEDFDVPGMLGNIVYIDLAGLEEPEAEHKLVDQVRHVVNMTRNKPLNRPPFPCTAEKYEVFKGDKPSFGSSLHRSVDVLANTDNTVESFGNLLDQLEQRSALAVRLVYALSVAADQGMPLESFVQWQMNAGGYSENAISVALVSARIMGVILTVKYDDNGLERTMLRLEPDYLQWLRKKELPEIVDSFITYLDDLFVRRRYQASPPDRSMFIHVFSLVERFKVNTIVIRTIYNKFFQYLYRIGLLEQAFALVTLFTKLIKHSGDRDSLQACYGNQALILRDWGRLEEAMELLREQEKVCIESGNRDCLGISYGNQALILKDWGRLLEAMELHKKVEAIYIELGNRDGLQRSLGNQAGILLDLGKLHEAMELLKKVEMICIDLGNLDSLQATYGNQALILMVWGRLREAMVLHKKKEAYCIESGNLEGLSISYGNQALILKDWGRLQEAMVLLKKEEEICITLGSKIGLQRSLGNQAGILLDWGKLQDAMELLKKQETICIELGNRDGLQLCFGNQALILQDWGRLQEALELHKKKEAICIELGNLRGLATSYGNQALILKKWERFQDAMELFKKQETICIRQGNMDGLQKSLGNQAGIFQAWGRLQEAMELLKKKESICVKVGLKPSLKICYRNQIDLYTKMGKKLEAEEVSKKLAALERELGQIKENSGSSL